MFAPLLSLSLPHLASPQALLTARLNSFRLVSVADCLLSFASGTGRTKKSGAGGKYTWGAQLIPDGDEEAVDQNDPNYDSGGLLAALCCSVRFLVFAFK